MRLAENRLKVSVSDFLQVPQRCEGVHPQWNKRRVGAGQSRAAHEAQRAADVGTTGQSGGQQGRHLAEAHRSESKTQTHPSLASTSLS